MQTRTRLFPVLLAWLLLLSRAAAAQTLPVTSGLRLHLKADAGVTTAGGTVSAWADQSGNGFNVTAGGAQQPAFTASAINGLPALTLDGNDDFLQSTASVDLLGGQQNYTFYAVTKAGATQKQFADIFDYAHAGFVNFVIQQDGANTNSFSSNGLAPQVIPAGTPSIFSGTFINNGGATTRVNGGSTLNQGSVGTNTFNVPNVFRVGDFVGGSGRQFNGQIAEILIYNRVLTGGEQAQVEAYLSDRYAITLAAAPFGNVVQLNGTTDAVIAAAPAYTADDNFTLEAWVKPNALPTGSFETIIANSFDNGTVGNGVALGIGSGSGSGGGANLVVLLSGIQFFNTGISFPTAGLWYHVAVARRGGTTFAYLDGVQAPNTLTTAPNAPQTSGGAASRFSVGSQNGLRFLHGQVDEARAWNVGRTQAEIQAAMTGEIAGNTAGLAACWRFNRSGQGAGLTVINHATSTGAAVSGTTVGTATTPVFVGAQAGNAVLFNGTTDGISIPTGAALTSSTASSFTVEALVKTTSTVGGMLFSQQRCTSGAVQLITGASGAVSFRVEDINDNGGTITGSIINDGLWHHVAGVRDVAADQIRLFVDGVLVAQTTDNTTATITNASTENWLGQRFPCANRDFWAGSLDEVRLWNVARTQGQLQARMNQALTGNETGLVLYYDMNRSGQGAGLTVSNGAAATGTAFDGTTAGTGTTPVFGLANNPGVVAAAPTISSFTPTSGAAGTSVTITGNNFSSATAVRFNGTAATTFNVVAATQLTAVVPAAATTGTVSVTTSRGTGTSAGTFTVTGAPPTDLTFFPTAGSPGSVVLVTAAGGGLTAATSARFNGAAATGTVFNSATQVTATVPFGAASGAVTTLTGATVLSGGSFTVTAAPAPTVRNFSPLRAPVGAVISVFGSNFSGITAVRFGTVNAPGFTVVSAAELTVPVPVGAVSGSRIFVVGAGGMAQSMRTFTLILPPTLTALAPTFGAVGAMVQLTGTNLANATSVSFGGGVEAVTFTVDSPTQITATIPVGATSGPVSVTTVAGTAATSAALSIVAGPAPVITAFSPTSGPIGQAVVLTGSGLTGASSVRFNGVEAVGFIVNSATQITATVPSGATTGRLTVLTPRGFTRSATDFRVTPATSGPQITSLTPTAGSPGALVILTGQRLTGATQVRFGGNVPAASFTVNSATQITATIPAGAVTGPIAVTTPGGSAASVSFTITAPPAPSILSFSPTSGPVGTVVTVTGANFTGVTAVRLSNVLVTGLNVASAGSLSFTVPTTAATGLISVFAAGGLMQPATAFTVIPPPTITAFSPASGSPGSQVLLTGTNLTGATVVRFGGVAAPTFTVNSGTSLTVTVPVGALTGTLSVTTPGGTATSAGTFTVTAPPPPTISALAPASGLIGAQVVITGTNLLGTTAVRVSGTPVESFLVSSNTQVVAQVPDGARTGRISLTTSGGQAVSPADFIVITPPDIDALTPIRGPVGTVVTLTGTGLSAATAIRFGGTAALTFSAAADGKSATATVPAGAATGPVSLTNPIATAVSAQAFTLTIARPDGIAWVKNTLVQVIPYPNPAPSDTRLTVRVLDWPAANGAPTVQLYDGLGRQLLSSPVEGQSEEATFDLHGLAAGLYVVRCGSGARQLLVTR